MTLHRLSEQKTTADPSAPLTPLRDDRATGPQAAPLRMTLLDKGEPKHASLRTLLDKGEPKHALLRTLLDKGGT